MTRLHTVCAGEGPLILFVHGIGSSATAWEKQFDRFAGQFSCIAPDLPGYGDSDDPDGDDLLSFVNAVAAVLDNRAAHVVGVSFGALVSLGLAKTHPHLVRSLTLADATLGRANVPQSERLDWLRQRKRLSEGLGTLSVERAKQIAGPQASDKIVQEIAAHMRRARPQGYMAVAAAVATTDARPWLGCIQQPALVVCGEHDTVTGIDVSQHLSMSLPHARSLSIAGAGHAPHIEEPDRFYRQVSAFIQEIQQ
ncbi:alpha/beta hydrolase [Cupriavidus pinatubonensis]|uniref:alpha/beta fold hydrolase n=1 Tax=Cupriavidus pinatubonensis TaxID=248026 RepID=UPI001C7389FA|nr:alpha/beta hydrolase [Cupriavidus pinatubonensis]QYY30870.1 alpha/beta hydrolase [Cupriavidus pinatubonensis]